ncbi:MAG: hypothetical protein V4613_13215 [Bacteroidota bacterium]
MLKELLLRKNRPSITAATQLVHDDYSLFRELIVYIGDKKDINLASMAAWTMSEVVAQNNSLLEPHYKVLLEVANNSRHGGIKRNIVRAFQFAEIPDTFTWDVADICLRFLSSKDEPIAVKAYSVTVLQHLALKIPDIKDEVVFELERQMPYSTPAFTVRAKAFFKALKKLEK